MAQLDKGKPQSLEELMLATLAQTDALTKLLIERRHRGRRVQAEAAGGACGVPAYPASHDTITTEPTAVSYRVKLTLFLLAFNIIGFAEGYLLHELGLLWVVPIVLITAFGAVLLSRRFL